MMAFAIALVWLAPQDAKDEIDTLRKRLDALERKLGPEGGGKYPTAELHLTIYTEAGYTLEEDPDDRSSFEVDRAYLYGLFQLAPDWKARATLDVGRDDSPSSDTRELEVFLKHAFVEYSGFAGAALNGGLIQTPWAPFEEKLWGYRFQGTVFSNREGYLATADLGVSFRRKLFENAGEYHVALTNGEGFKNPEVSGDAGKYKALEARVTIHPFPDDPFWKALAIHEAAFVGQYDRHESRLRQQVMVSFKNDDVTLAAEYLWAKDPPHRMAVRQPSLSALGTTTRETTGRGYGVFGVVNLGLVGFPREFAALGRHERWDPSDDLSRNDHYRYILGASYAPLKHVTFLLDWERTIFDSRAGKEDENGVFLHVEIKV